MSVWQIGVTASSLGNDPRQIPGLSRQAGFHGLQFDALWTPLRFPELSGTGRRELLRLLAAESQQLIGLRYDIGPKGLGRGSDTDRILSEMDRIMEAAKSMAAPLVCVDLGALPEDGGVDAALAELGRRADRYSVILAFRSDLATYAALDGALGRAGCPWFGVDLDPAAVLRDDWDMDQVFSRLGRSVRHVRARDANLGAGRRTSPAVIGRGSVAWDGLVAALDGAGYRGWMTVDPVDLADRPAAAVSGLRYLLGAMK